MLPRLRFHPRCGDRVTLVCNKKTVVRNCSQLLGALSFSAEALRDNELFEVRIIKKEGVWNGHIDFGVTSYNPNKAEYMPLEASQIQEPTWIMSGSTVSKNGTSVADPYGDDLDMLVEGDCLGVMRSQKGELIYFVNNHCLGVAAENIPAHVFAVIELTGKYMEVTITRQEIIPEEVRLRQQEIIALEEPSSSSFNEIPMAESIEVDSSVSGGTNPSIPYSVNTTPDEAVVSPALSNSTDSEICPSLQKNTISSMEEDQTAESPEDNISSAPGKENVQPSSIRSCSVICDEPEDCAMDLMTNQSSSSETPCPTPDSDVEVHPPPPKSTHTDSPKDIVTSPDKESWCTDKTSSKFAVASTLTFSQVCRTDKEPSEMFSPENLDQIDESYQTNDALTECPDIPSSAKENPVGLELKQKVEMLSTDPKYTNCESRPQSNGSDANLSAVLDQDDNFPEQPPIEESNIGEEGIEEDVSSNNIVSDNKSSRPSKLFDTITKETVNRLRSRRALEAYGADSDIEKANIECTSLPDASISAAATAPQTQYYNITGELVDRWARGHEVTGDTDESDSDSIFNDYRETKKPRHESPQIEVHHTSPPASPSPESSAEVYVNDVVLSVERTIRRAIETSDQGRDRRTQRTLRSSLYRLGDLPQQDWVDPRNGSPPLVDGESVHSLPREEVIPSLDEQESDGLREVVVEPNILLPNISSIEDFSSRSGSSVSEVPPDYGDPHQGNVISAADNRDPFRFHRNRGTSIKFSSDFSVAERIRPMDDYNNAVCLTHRPLGNNELFQIRIEKLIDKWSGGIELGVTGHNPRHMDLPSTMTNLPSRTFILSGCKLLVNGKPSGFQMTNFSLDDVQVGDCIGMTRNRDGNLHFYLNGVDQGKAASNVPPTVWGVVDLYGTAVKVSVVNSTQQVLHPILPVHNRQLDVQEHRFHFIPRALLPADIDNETLLFHSSQCTDIVIADNGKSAHRADSSEGVSSGVVTTDRPLLDNQQFVVRLVGGEGLLDIGVTTQTPKHQNYIQNIKNHTGCWALSGADIVHEGNIIISHFTDHLKTLVEGDKVGVLRNEKGELHFFVNGMDKGLAASDVPEILYGFIVLHDRSTKVTIVDPIKDCNLIPEVVVAPEPPVPELCFNRVHGRNAHLSADMTVASRPAEFSEFNEGVLFSSRPLRECELFQVRVDKIIDCWIGSLEIGVTALKPSELWSCGVERVAGTATELMWHTYVLSGASVVSDGAALVHRYPLDLDAVTTGSHVGVMWHGDRSLHFYMDGIDQGHACFLPPQLELYAVIDLYGQCTEVTLVPGREHCYWGSGHSDNSLALLGGLQGTIQTTSPDSFSEYCGQNVVVRSKEKVAHRVSREGFGSLVFSASHLGKGQKFEVAVIKCDNRRMSAFSFGLTDLNILNVHVNRNFPGRISQIPSFCCYLSGGALVVNQKIEYKKTGCFPTMDSCVFADRITMTRHDDGEVSVAYNHTDLGVVFTNLPEKVFVVFDLSGCVSGLQAVTPRKIKITPSDAQFEDISVGAQTEEPEQICTKQNFTFKSLSPENISISKDDTKATRVSDYEGGMVVTKQPLSRGNSFKFSVDSESVGLGYAGGLLVGAVGRGSGALCTISGALRTQSGALSLHKQCWILSSTLLNIHGTLTPIPPRMKAKFRTIKLNSKIELQFSESAELILFVDQLKVGVIAIIPDEFTEIYPLVDIRGKCEEISILNDEMDGCGKIENPDEHCGKCDLDENINWYCDENIKENALKNFSDTIRELLPSTILYGGYADGEIPTLSEWLDATSVILDPQAPRVAEALDSDTDSESFDTMRIPREVEYQEDLDVSQLPDDVFNLMTTGVIGYLPEDINSQNSISVNSMNENFSDDPDQVSDYMPGELLDVVISPTTDFFGNDQPCDMPGLKDANDISDRFPYEKNMDKSLSKLVNLDQEQTCPQEMEQSPIGFLKVVLPQKFNENSSQEIVETSTEIIQKCPLADDDISKEFEDVLKSLKTEMIIHEPNELEKSTEGIVNDDFGGTIREPMKDIVNQTSEVANECTFTEKIGVDEESDYISEENYKLLEDFIYICYKQELESASLAPPSEIKALAPTFVQQEDWEYIKTIVNGVYDVVAGSGKDAAEYLLGEITSPGKIENDADSDNSIWDDLDSPFLETDNTKVAEISDKIQETCSNDIISVECAQSVTETINECHEDTISVEASDRSSSLNSCNRISEPQSSIDEVSKSLETSKEENDNLQSNRTKSSEEERVSELVYDESEVEKPGDGLSCGDLLEEEISEIVFDGSKYPSRPSDSQHTPKSVEQKILAVHSDEYNTSMPSDVVSHSVDNVASRGDESHLKSESSPLSSLDGEASDMEKSTESSKREFGRELSLNEASLGRNDPEPMRMSVSNSPSKNNPVSSSGSSKPPSGSRTNHDIHPTIKYSGFSKSVPDLTKYHDVSIYKDSYFKDINENLVTYHLNNGGTLEADSDSGFKFFIQLHLILYGNRVPFVKPVSRARSQICHKDEVSSSIDSSSEQSEAVNLSVRSTEDLEIRKAVFGSSPLNFLETIINESHPIISNIDQKKIPAIDLFLYAVAENDANIRRYILDDLIETSAIIDPFEYKDEDHIQLHKFFETLRRRYVSSEYNDEVFFSYENDYEDSLTGRGPLMFVEGIVGANSDTGITFMMNSNVVTRNPRRKQFGYPYTSVYDIKIRPLKEKDRPENFDNDDRRNAKYVNKPFVSEFLREGRESKKDRDERAKKFESSLMLAKSTVNVMSTQFYIPDSEADEFIEIYGSYLLGLILDRGLMGDDCAEYSDDSYRIVAEGCNRLSSAMHFWWNWVPKNKRPLMWGNVECYCADCIPAGAPDWIKDWVRVSRVVLCSTSVFGRFWSIRAGVLPNLLADFTPAKHPLNLVKCKQRPPLTHTIQPDQLFSTLWVDEYGKVCIVNIVIEIIPDRNEDTMVSYLIRLTVP